MDTMIPDDVMNVLDDMQVTTTRRLLNGLIRDAYFRGNTEGRQKAERESLATLAGIIRQQSDKRIRIPLDDIRFTTKTDEIQMWEEEGHRIYQLLEKANND